MLWNFSVWSKTVPPRWQSIVILVLSNAAVALFTQMFVQIPIMKQINMTLPKKSDGINALFGHFYFITLVQIYHIYDKFSGKFSAP